MSQALISFTTPQLAIIKSTVAKDATPEEFNLFLQACSAYGLDPFRKQIFLIIYNKDKPDKRKHAIIPSRDGFRVMAHRCGDYRPASAPAQIVYDETLKGPTNPKGIVSATVTLWKQDKKGEWFAVSGEAYWDEFAPVTDQWAENPETRRREPTGKKTLDASGNWAKMPIVMITKCAESQALRAGWPETFGNLYSEEEMDRVAADATASEAIEAHARAEREARTGGRGLLMVFDESMVLQKVPMGSVADRVAAFIDESDPLEVHKFRLRNEDPLREFWTFNPTDALELKKKFEAKERQLTQGQS